MLLECGAAPTIDLSGRWQFSLAGGAWRDIDVPSAWELSAVDFVIDGPARYRRTFDLPRRWLFSDHVVLEADAVSYACAVHINGVPAGEHRGMWSRFQLDLAGLLKSGQNTVELEVYKPGPHFPPRASLAGFLPDVCTTFGGVWQGLRLRAMDGLAAADVCVVTRAPGRLRASLRMAGDAAQDAEGTLTLLDGRRALGAAELRYSPRHKWHIADMRVDVRPWSAAAPSLYTARIAARHGRHTLRIDRRVGFRDVRTRADAVLVNGTPQHLRGVLDWGWNPRRVAPLFSHAEARDQFAKARTLGFNMIKLCLFVPNDAVFEAADEAGMFLWLELPMWQPEVDDAFRARALAEYDAILRRVHHHPSIIVVSLGCELDRRADAALLGALRGIVRRWMPGALLCDNSGGAAAYDGVETPENDFRDHHFYTDPHFFEPLVDHFSRGTRAGVPWIYGEFCDADTLRVVADDSAPADDGSDWWKHARVPDHAHSALVEATRGAAGRLRAADIADGGAELARLARQQATEVRKYILESTRARSAGGGYVLTGWADTPISTSGIVDDARALKFEPRSWTRFNGDVVLWISRSPRRQWTRGADRPLRVDPFTFRLGDVPQIELGVSNGSADLNDLSAEWVVRDSAGQRIGGGSCAIRRAPGGRNTQLATFPLDPGPASTLPATFRLEAELRDARGRAVAQNDWLFTGLPPTPTAGLRWSERLSAGLLARVRAGRSAVVWQRPDVAWCIRAPFWREAVHVFAPHALWEAVPRGEHADMRFFGVATDSAIDPAGLARELGVDAAALLPVWRRFDARQWRWSAYIVEAHIGLGSLFVSSLRFAGGHGAQADGLDPNPMGAWMLSRLCALAA